MLLFGIFYKYRGTSESENLKITEEFDNIFIGDDILVEDIGYPDEAKTEQNIQALTRFSENSRIPTYVMLIPTKCAI